MIFYVELRLFFLDLIEVGVRHDLENEAHDTMAELRGRISFGKITLQAMNDVHLKVHELTIDGMF